MRYVYMNRVVAGTAALAVLASIFFAIVQSP